VTPDEKARASLKKVWEACTDDPSIEWNVSNASELKRCITRRDGKKLYTWTDGETMYRRVW